jgi:hypothetical protein
LSVVEGAIYVLVAGEARELQGNCHADRDFQHTSLPFVGSAFEALRASGVERDKIIVVAQLEDYLHDTLALWTLTSSATEKVFIEGQIGRTTAACSRLIEEGGADYDREEVNPFTVLNVLTGGDLGGFGSGSGGSRGRDRCAGGCESKSAEPKRVIPDSHCGPVVLAIYSHGDSHLATSVSATTETLHLPHTASNAEWFCHMPYPSPQIATWPAAGGGGGGSSRNNLLAFVSSSGAGLDPKTGHPRAPCFLYSTQLLLAFAAMFRKQPHRPVVALLNYCRSGGSCGFMHRPGAIEQLGLDKWPLYLMSSSGPHSDSLVGGLWNAWFASFTKQLADAQQEKRKERGDNATATTATVVGVSSSFSSASSPSSLSSTSPTSLASTLEDVFKAAAVRYSCENVYELTNEVKMCAFSRPVWMLEFQFQDRKVED